MTENYSRICIGTWKLFEKNNLQEGIEIINYAISNGFNSFDTAHVYMGSLPEKVLGSNNSSIWIADKLSAKIKDVENISVKEAYPENYVLSFISAIKENISKLDVLQIHNWSPSWGNKEYNYLINIIKSVDFFDSLSFGVSLSFNKNYSAESISPFEYVQLPLNIINTSNKDLINTHNSSKKFLVRDIFSGGTLDFRKESISMDESFNAFKYVYANNEIYKTIVGCNSKQSIDLLKQYIDLIETENRGF